MPSMRDTVKEFRYIQLFDAYGPLLTEHQRDVCELYYMCDLSLTEIAEQKGISKQSVSEVLAKSRQLLDEYEEKLHVLRTRKTLEEVKKRLTAFSEKYPQFSDELNKILAEFKEQEE